MKQIVQKEEKVLRQIATDIPLTDISTPKTSDLIHDMMEALAKEPDGVALAAPQVGESVRLFVVSPMAYEAIKFSGTQRFVFINPVIVKRSREKKLMEEGCLSVRPLYGKVRRSTKVTVEAYDETGKKFRMIGTGLLAQIFQHEIDHLDGVLFIDKAKDIMEVPKEVYAQQ